MYSDFGHNVWFWSSSSPAQSRSEETLKGKIRVGKGSCYRRRSTGAARKDSWWWGGIRTILGRKCKSSRSLAVWDFPVGTKKLTNPTSATGVWLDYLSGMYLLFPEVTGKGKIIFGCVTGKERKRIKKFARVLSKLPKTNKARVSVLEKLTLFEPVHLITLLDTQESDISFPSSRSGADWTFLSASNTALPPTIIEKIDAKGHASVVKYGHHSTTFHLHQWLATLDAY